MFNRKFVGERITTLRLKKDISERELSFSLGKGGNFINSISSGRALPRMDNFFDICDFFEITPFEFFFTEIDDPITTKQIYDELKRLSNNDLSEFLLILKTMNPSDYTAFISFMNRYNWNKNHS